jgi:N-acyl-phosphatidylethanolamine-hydrolysing phospholipase D
VAAQGDRLVTVGRALAALALAALAAPAAGAAPPHHTAEGFRNNYPHAPKESFWAWKWSQLRDGVPEPPRGGWRFPSQEPDLGRLNAPREPQLTWIGHAAFLLQLGGLNVLVDPQFSGRASPVQLMGPRRIVPLPLPVEDLPRIDVVLTSHNHYDHLDVGTVKRLAALPSGSPLFLVPLGLASWFRGHGIERVEEYDWWQSREVEGVRFTLVPVQHWSKRTLWDTNRTLWGGWVMEGGGRRVIHTGDLGYSRDARDIGERLGPFDLALIPIGAYAPRWFMKTMHVDVAEALQVRADLGAARAIGMHWGTFEGLTDEPMDEPPALLERLRTQAGLSAAQFGLMRIGETRSIEKAR